MIQCAERERGGRREGGKERERERKRERKCTCVCVFIYFYIFAEAKEAVYIDSDDEDIQSGERFVETFDKNVIQVIHVKYLSLYLISFCFRLISKIKISLSLAITLMFIDC